ncbi:MAG: protein translocase subunit SecD [Candidatus Peribacteraceae bacterium]
MASSKRSFGPHILVLLLVVACVIALPNDWKPWAPKILKPDVHLGLDLAGGTQLDFRISEDELVRRKDVLNQEIEAMKAADAAGEAILLKQNELFSVEEQHRNIVEAIRTVLERRINSLGVSEATITPSYFGDEKHLLVECPGIVDKEKCLKTVGKTIQLEFKEQFTGEETGYAEEMRARANKSFAEATKEGGSLQRVGEDLSDQLGISYFDERTLYVNDLPQGLESIASMQPGDSVRRTEGSIQSVQQNDDGTAELIEIPGIYLTEVLVPRLPTERPVSSPDEALKAVSASVAGSTVKTENAVNLATLPSYVQSVIAASEIGSLTETKADDGAPALVYIAGKTESVRKMGASHILVQYQGAERADPTVTRTKAEAQTRANELKAQLDAGTAFATLARAESDGPSKAKAGSLGTIAAGVMGTAFDNVAFSLPVGGVSNVTETPFGFHIIRADKASFEEGGTASYTALTAPQGTDVAALKGQIEENKVMTKDDAVVVRSIFFSLRPTGWKDTALNGQRFRSASVTVDPTTNIPVVQIQFDEEGGKIFQELTKRNIGKPIAIFVGGEMVSAPTVQTEIIGGTAVITGSRTYEEARTLAQDLNTGAIPAPIFLSGQTTVEATLGKTALHQSVIAAGIGLVALSVFLLAIYGTLGVIAVIALALYVVLLVTAIKLPLLLISNQYIVLTLAGIAGLILSMGMAVDANVLIFERIREELKKGKLIKTAVETGFKRAWPSIRDGNFSTLITCAILFMIGTSIIKGFSVALSIGIITSMFTAVVLSRWMCRKLAASPLGEKMSAPRS